MQPGSGNSRVYLSNSNGGGKETDSSVIETTESRERVKGWQHVTVGRDEKSPALQLTSTHLRCQCLSMKGWMVELKEPSFQETLIRIYRLKNK